MSNHVDQVGGDHYAGDYQHWDWAIDTQLPPMEYAATKYITRWWKKNGVQDLDKARSHLVKLKGTAARQPGWLAGNRHNKNFDLLTKYLDSTEVPEPERTLIIMIDGLTSAADLDRAIEQVDKFIATAQGRSEGGNALPGATPAHWPAPRPLGRPSEQAGGRTEHPAPFGYQGDG